MKDLRGKRVLISGSARGIGLEMALKFAEKGADLVLSDIDERALPEALETVAVFGGAVHAYPLDVTRPDAVLGLRQRLVEEVGPIDVLVNNAGVVFGGPFLEVPLDQHAMTYRVNALGLVAMTHAFLPDLISRPEASLVNIASASAFIGLPFGSTYASSKWAVLGFSESLRLELSELGHRHVHVCAVCPSYIGTGMFEGARPPTTTRVLEPEFIAAAVVKAVVDEQLYVLEPWLVKITPALKGLLPTRLWDSLSSALGASSGMSGWIGHREEGAEDG
ncbi:MAG: SDR family NAD(P)-dependent oxidoreductase [Acidobacteriota bacterium]|nr:MAG: SDR family NAD(P)-dependent oxidoreductase [Acidobacteriota bacterium]